MSVLTVAVAAALAAAYVLVVRPWRMRRGCGEDVGAQAIAGRRARPRLKPL